MCCQFYGDCTGMDTGRVTLQLLFCSVQSVFWFGMSFFLIILSFSGNFDIYYKVEVHEIVKWGESVLLLIRSEWPSFFSVHTSCKFLICFRDQEITSDGSCFTIKFRPRWSIMHSMLHYSTFRLNSLSFEYRFYLLSKGNLILGKI